MLGAIIEFILNALTEVTIMYGEQNYIRFQKQTSTVYFFYLGFIKYLTALTVKVFEIFRQKLIPVVGVHDKLISRIIRNMSMDGVFLCFYCRANLIIASTRVWRILIVNLIKENCAIRILCST